MDPLAAAAEPPLSLKTRLRRSERARQWRALALILPLLLFLIVTFVVPIGSMLWRSVEDREVGPVLPQTIAALQHWDGTAAPDDAAFAALARDLTAARAAGTVLSAAKRLNYAISGFRTVLLGTTRHLPLAPDAGPVRDALIAIDPHWGDPAFWAAIKQAAGPLSDFYLLAAVDRHHTPTGAIVRVPANTAIYLDVLGRTFAISLAVTLSCLVLGFPVAYLLATQPARRANLLMIMVLLPFWTSLLARTAAWIVLLQREGLVNQLLLALGLIDQPLQLVYNRVGVLVAMTHVLLPFMILPLYSVMKGIPPSLMRAATSLGAPPAVAFVRIYLPQTLPGLAAGGLLVFILALGYYITPALIGGASDQMISYFIAFYTTDTVNWGMASALGAVLLTATLILAAVYGWLMRDGKAVGLKP
ncbi:MAG: ABC transporter permease [Azospirillaceae bacterium]|nr:ABC transporter permease [Azospirillaceae bacterium]